MFSSTVKRREKFDKRDFVSSVEKKFRFVNVFGEIDVVQNRKHVRCLSLSFRNERYNSKFYLWTALDKGEVFRPKCSFSLSNSFINYNIFLFLPAAFPAWDNFILSTPLPFTFPILIIVLLYRKNDYESFWQQQLALSNPVLIERRNDLRQSIKSGPYAQEEVEGMRKP